MQVAQQSRVLIVDDSSVMRSLLRTVLAGDPTLEVAGTAADGASALAAIPVVRPDVVLLDVEMPVMDGLSTLRRIRQCARDLPVIMCSGLTRRGAHVTIEALADGASDYVAKPSGQMDRDASVKALRMELLPKISQLLRRGRVLERGATGRVAPRPTTAGGTPPRIIAIGVSTGGPAVLAQVLPRLPACFPVPILIVQHMPALFTSLLAERLAGDCALRVIEAQHGLAVQPGTVAIAPGDWHMEVTKLAHTDGRAMLRLHQGPAENYCRPSADVLFRSVADAYGASAVGVVLTGMGCDGVHGCEALHAHGATVIAQDEATSTVWGMPGAVVAAGLAHRVLPVGAIAAELQNLVMREAASERRERV